MRARVIDILYRISTIQPELVNRALGLIYPLHPRRIRDIPGLWSMMIRHYLGGRTPSAQFPPVDRAMNRPDGLIAIGGPLTTERLMAAYRNGIYPWCHISPMKWWAPSERMVLFPEDAHISKSLRKTLRNGPFRVTFDSAFGQVIRACALPRPGKLPLTWITPQIIEQYTRLHSEGYAHSVEVWNENGTLVGGEYGVAIGGVFFAESAFSFQREASKVAFVTLVSHLHNWDFKLYDYKRYSVHSASQGGRLIKRAEFMDHLSRLRDQSHPPSPWVVDDALDVASWKPASAIAKDKGHARVEASIHLSLPSR